MPSYLQRKYVDLILQASSKWVNWDPPIEIKVGAYGTVDKETGELRVEGNIYDAAFRDELTKHGIKIDLNEYLPVEGAIEQDFVVASRGAKHRDLNVDTKLKVPGIVSAFFKGQWLFARGKRDAVLIMHSPRQIYIPKNNVLGTIYNVDKLIDKWLVTNIHVCPAYSMYLSDKLGDKVSLALVAQVPVAGVAGITAGASGGFTWWTDAQTGIHRQACSETGNYTFTPLYSLRRPIKRVRRWIRDTIRPEPEGDDLWHNDSPPWDPLDEDGEEDPFDPVSVASVVSFVVGFSQHAIGILGDPGN
ncbi:hypothetical protein OG21DRAFT_1470252 [Imleria badia]|nr:hypothetical protein OG21DRAFT_1470252 [Imleria badia]